MENIHPLLPILIRLCINFILKINDPPLLTKIFSLLLFLNTKMRILQCKNMRYVFVEIYRRALNLRGG